MAALTWTTITGAQKSATTTGAVNATFGAAADDGIPLTGLGGIVVYCEADSTKVISTAFALTAYVLEPYSGVWCRAPDYDLTSTITGTRGVLMGSFFVSMPAGRLAYAPSAGAVDSGSITVRILGTQSGLTPVLL
jgi:hypothetical protein